MSNRKSSAPKASCGRTMARLAREHGQARRTVQSALALTAEIIRSELQAHGVFRLRNVGTFRLHELPARIRRNPRTGEMIEVEPRRVVRFKPTQRMASVIA